jgi:adenylosuccinate synthase
LKNKGVEIIPAISITGAQWGDEAKGKASDAVNDDAEVVVKYHGGNNAGTTYIVNGKERIQHYVPGSVHKGIRGLLAAGVVTNAEDLEAELEPFNGLDSKLFGIDPRSHMVMPYHKSMDMAQEHYRNSQAAKTDNKGAMGAIGTTHKGMGPVHKDRADRIGVTFFELTSGSKALESKLRENYQKYKTEIEGRLGFQMVVPKGGNFGAELVSYTENEMVERQIELGQKLKKYLTDVSQEVIQTLLGSGNVVFQASQGIMLDLDWGDYPKVTSSHPSPGSIPTCVGVPMTLLRDMECIGVTKAYNTKVGSGPVAACLDGQTWPVDENFSEPEALHIRAKGKEFGATTKRARRVAWLDIVQLEYSAQLSGLTQFALTKLDVLGGLDKIKIAHGYEINGKPASTYTNWNLERMSQIKPVYTELEGFTVAEVIGAKHYDDLPDGAKSLVRMIEDFTKVPVTLISTGPKGTDTIVRKNFKGF